MATKRTVKCFLHSSTTTEDPDMYEAIKKFGIVAYFVIHRLAEIQCQEFDLENPGSNIFNKEYLEDKFQSISGLVAGKFGSIWEIIEPILRFFQKKHRIYLRVNPNGTISIKNIKLKDLLTDYTKKLLKDSEKFQKDSKKSQNYSALKKLNLNKKEKDTNGSAKNLPTLLQIFGNLFKEKFNEIYPANFGKDGKILKDLEKLYGRDRTIELMNLFFYSNDPFIVENPNIGTFKIKIPSLIAKEKTPKPEWTKTGKLITCRKCKETKMEVKKFGDSDKFKGTCICGFEIALSPSQKKRGNER